MTIRDEVHHLVDALPDDKLPQLRDALREQALPRSLADAPFDDEPLTEEERAALAESRADLDAGRVVSHAQLMREMFRE